MMHLSLPFAEHFDLAQIPSSHAIEESYGILHDRQGIGSDRHQDLRLDAIQKAAGEHFPRLLELARERGYQLPGAFRQDQRQLEFLLHHAMRAHDVRYDAVFERGNGEASFHDLLAEARKQGYRPPGWLRYTDQVTVDPEALRAQWEALQSVGLQWPFEHSHLGHWMQVSLQFPSLNMSNYEAYVTKEGEGWGTIDVESLSRMLLDGYPMLLVFQQVQQTLGFPLSALHEGLKTLTNAAIATNARMHSYHRFGKEDEHYPVAETYAQMMDEARKAAAHIETLLQIGEMLAGEEGENPLLSPSLLLLQDIYRICAHGSGQQPDELLIKNGFPVDDDIAILYQRARVVSYIGTIRRVLHQIADKAVFAYDGETLCAGALVIPVQEAILGQQGWFEQRHLEPALALLEPYRDGEGLTLRQLAHLLGVRDVVGERVGSFDWNSFTTPEAMERTVRERMHGDLHDSLALRGFGATLLRSLPGIEAMEEGRAPSDYLRAMLYSETFVGDGGGVIGRLFFADMQEWREQGMLAASRGLLALDALAECAKGIAAGHADLLALQEEIAQQRAKLASVLPMPAASRSMVRAS